MKPIWQRILVIVLIVLAIIAILWALTWFVPAIKNEMPKVDPNAPNRHVWLFLAGLAAPFIFVFKRISEWFSKTFLGGGLPAGSPTAQIDSEMKALREQVNRSEEERRKAVAEADAKLARIEEHLTRLRGELSNIDQKIAEVKARPEGRTRTNEELIEIIQNEEGYVDVYNRPQ